MHASNVKVPKSFLDMQREAMDFFNQGALAHRVASSQEEWEKLWLEVLKKHGLHTDADMTSLVYVAEEDRETSTMRVIH